MIKRYFNIFLTFTYVESNSLLIYYLKGYNKIQKFLLIICKEIIKISVKNFLLFFYLNLVVERRVYNDYMTRLNPYSNYMRNEFLKYKEKNTSFNFKKDPFLSKNI